MFVLCGVFNQYGHRIPHSPLKSQRMRLTDNTRRKFERGTAFIVITVS